MRLIRRTALRYLIAVIAALALAATALALAATASQAAAESSTVGAGTAVWHLAERAGR